MYAFLNPQSNEGVAILLARQLYKCRDCSYDWNPLVDLLINEKGLNKNLDRITECNIRLIKRLKRRVEEGRKPEVDHILAIKDGGASIGFENHQILCCLCHKAKTKIGNSGPRKKKV